MERETIEVTLHFMDKVTTDDEFIFLYVDPVSIFDQLIENEQVQDFLCQFKEMIMSLKNMPCSRYSTIHMAVSKKEIDYWDLHESEDSMTLETSVSELSTSIFSYDNMKTMVNHYPHIFNRIVAL